ncbi:four helix bundle protein [Psychroserpens damuponensis]|uniref:four helix bundle protein n=1 Tax=Psychroserpens damuponensis TaxID=943936 RepID=UPI00058AD50A|nr:four helix bundle protein [Psychroserpens damuponensis]
MLRFQGLLAYKKGFALAMKIFDISKSFPKEETYSRTYQFRRSSTSVCTNIAESYRKRLYPKYFLSKLSDCDTENSETQTWIEFAYACNFILENQFNELITESLEVGKLINYKILNPNKFGLS